MVVVGASVAAALLGVLAAACSSDDDSDAGGGNAIGGGAGATGGTAVAGGTGGATGGTGGATGGTGGDSGGTGGDSGGTGGDTGGTGGATGGTGGDSGGTGGTGGDSGGTGGTGAVVMQPWAPSQACIDLADSYLAQMDLDEKVGQMTQAIGGDAFPTSDVAAYLLGSVAFGGGNTPPGGPTSGNWADYADTLQSIAMSTRLGIPLVIGVDAVHGMSKAEDATFFPHNIGLGCSGDLDLVERVHRITALEMAGSGINWAFTPTVAAARDITWGRTYECFSETPDLAGSMGTAATLGLQDGTLGSSATSVLACAKHFAGDGATNGGVNAGETTMDEALFRQLCVDQYRPLVDAGVGSIMVSYSSWNGVELHGHQYLLTDVLKNELGFQGFLVSDWGGISAVGVAQGINAGLDMVMIPPTDSYARFIDTLRTAVNSGDVPQSRADDAVRRILTIKCEMGLFEPTYTGMVDRSLTSQVGSAEHRAVAREAVRKSIVMVKNDNNVLPLSKTARIHVAGSSADNGDNQCGGWCVDWQGSGSLADETTVLQGIQNAATTGTVTYSDDASGSSGNDAVVVVIGETPYAEGMGDSNDLSLSAADRNTLNNAASAEIPVVVVLVTGRPLIITDELAQADAWLAAWLPGTEGDGVADVLFGDHAPTASLTFSWPRDMAQIPINVDDNPYDPLFPFGHGLTY